MPDPDVKNLEVTVGTDRIDVDFPATPVYKRLEEKGHWKLHAFYCDTHLDTPSEVVVARELKNEDLELDLGHFLPSQPRKIACVMTFRIHGPFPYPTVVPGQTVSYPPLKGLIKPGMLECDLQMLPWHSDEIDASPIVINVDTTTLSDGKQNKSYFPNDDDNSQQDGSLVYKYHSDRPDAPKLLVTVYHGRVTEVAGGAEETSDVPYAMPPRQPQDIPPDQK